MHSTGSTHTHEYEYTSAEALPATGPPHYCIYVERAAGAASLPPATRVDAALGEANPVYRTWRAKGWCFLTSRLGLPPAHNTYTHIPRKMLQMYAPFALWSIMWHRHTHVTSRRTQYLFRIASCCGQYCSKAQSQVILPRVDEAGAPRPWDQPMASPTARTPPVRWSNRS